MYECGWVSEAASEVVEHSSTAALWFSVTTKSSDRKKILAPEDSKFCSLAK